MMEQVRLEKLQVRCRIGSLEIGKAKLNGFIGFAAAQAAQKIKTLQPNTKEPFAAAQAAQKCTRHDDYQFALFAAAQAAQRHAGLFDALIYKSADD